VKRIAVVEGKKLQTFQKEQKKTVTQSIESLKNIGGKREIRTWREKTSSQAETSKKEERRETSSKARSPRPQIWEAKGVELEI